MGYKNKNDLLLWQRRRYAERKRFLLKIKSKKGKCSLCGWSKFPELLQFHHKYRKDKSFNINSSRLANYSLFNLKKEINKCILICPNCHAEIHMKDGNFHGDKLNL